MSALLLLLAGLLLVTIGADRLVAGAGRLATRFGVSPLVVGLTVVAFGTSAPEIVVTMLAVARGAGEVAVGNLVGTNIFNVLVILGAAAVLTPLAVARPLIRIEVPVLIGASVATIWLARDGGMGRLDGLLLVSAFAYYLTAMVRRARRERHSATNGGDDAGPVPGSDASAARPRAGALGDTGWVVVGLALLVAGAQALITGAVGLARLAGVSELTIGLTILAAGTSLPEVATSVVAALRRQSDMAVGNAIGSSIFNLLFVLGLGAAIAPATVEFPPAALRFDVFVMLAAAVACLPIFMTGHRIDRWEGVVFLGVYAGYLAYLLLDAQGHQAAETARTALSWFVAPLTLLTVGVLGSRWLGRRRPDVVSRQRVGPSAATDEAR